MAATKPAGSDNPAAFFFQGETGRNTRGLLRLIILCTIAAAAVASRLFSVIRFESIIHEFDPWFNFRATKYLVNHGFYAFWDWFDDRTWHPLGRVTGGTLYPGLMVTSGTIYHVLRFLTLPVDIRNICVLLAPGFSGLTAFASYLFTSEMSDSPSAGLLAAIFMGIAPGYISRSVAGSYDNEAIAIFLLVFTFYLWIKAVKLGSIMWGALTALFYGYMVSAWGGYVFITNLLPLHAFVLTCMGRFSPRLYVSYTTWYALGTLASMQIPFVGFLPIRSSDHMAALGVFGLMQLVGAAEWLRSQLPSKQFQTVIRAAVLLIFAGAFGALVLLTVSGVVAPWSGRFYSLWDTGYAKIHIPIIASVSEHQPTAWPAFFFDLNMLIWLFPAGVYMCFRNLKDEQVFIVIYAVLASYFAGVMVRLMLTLTPIVCVAAAMALSQILDTFLVASSPNEGSKTQANGTPSSANANGNLADKFSALPDTLRSTKSPLVGIYSYLSKSLITGAITSYLLLFVLHCTWVTSNAYSSPSVVLASRLPDGSQHIIDDYREAYYWLRQNTPETAKIMSWWDYGYQIGGMADRPTLVDNNTWNNTHIATVGKAMSSREEVSYPIMKQHEVDYVLVVFGGLLGYSGDDINKFLWMVRIAEGIWPDEINERDYFTPRGEYRVDDQATPTMRNSLMYKMSYYNYDKLFPGGQAMDRVRGSRLPAEGPQLNSLEEAFTSENWIIRIFKVKDYDNLGRSHQEASAFEKGNKRKKAAGTYRFLVVFFCLIVQWDWGPKGIAKSHHVAPWRYLLRRAAARSLTAQPSRSISSYRPTCRVTASHPTSYRAFHQCRIWRAEGEQKREGEASPADASTSGETVTTEATQAEESIKEGDIKEESIATPDVADAAQKPSLKPASHDAVSESSGTTSAPIGQTEAPTETEQPAESISEKAQDLASSAAQTAQEATSSAAQTVSSAASSAAQKAQQSNPFEKSPSPTEGRPRSSPSRSPSRILYVGNLFFEVTAPQLEKEFSKLGEITNSRVVLDSRGLSKGFGYIEFATQEAADLAVRQQDQKVFQGRRMAVQYHLPKTGLSPRGQISRRLNPPSKTLFIGNMSYQMSDRDLNDLFREIRNVLDVRVAIDRRSGQPRGFAHADFIDVASAEKAKAHLEKKVVYGRPLKVDYSADSYRSRSAPQA
ncbi:Dolichyl-diphosphooligosaccharide--protein glycosyltransferase subunit [Hortaea werneckii]|nr:Dolichyl-diphosphooligosaccharide--protein glycosyltransferase subunit [Hortaea werneckii]KAI7092740.1 Dolichyl-diphosphooligosaccharide--protein glycosyltransferase subunit [Hortaea werneckii]KAI7231330.1 Dolichyl-diphosphooligosaccharide--protein glycosyltransferase subunit [Hortaea werneckii]KAI7304335.1 Dolichyl-diphosphooligosaccharide--protein glycosyltransferase subunit [Hortaea werneckii]KAI7389486.1 Dolichyl-diphosphooligosaccharide--protein glycosyltransferase subunit [Hortaea wern